MAEERKGAVTMRGNPMTLRIASICSSGSDASAVSR